MQAFPLIQLVPFNLNVYGSSLSPAAIVYYPKQNSAGLFAPVSGFIRSIANIIDGTPISNRLPYPYNYGPYAWPMQRSQNNAPSTRQKAKSQTAQQ